MKKSKGTTLIEMLVYIFLFLLVFIGIHRIFNSATQYYYLSIASVDVQQSALSASYRLSRELSESALSSIKLYNTTPKGIVFMSPRDSAGTISFQTASPYEGEVYWYKYVAYYLDTDPGDSSLYAIYIKEYTPTGSPFSEATGSTTYTTSWFATGGGASLSYKIVATNIVDMNIYDEDGVSSGTPTSAPIYINITARATSSGKSNDIQTTDSIEVMNE